MAPFGHSPLCGVRFGLSTASLKRLKKRMWSMSRREMWSTENKSAGANET